MARSLAYAASAMSVRTRVVLSVPAAVLIGLVGIPAAAQPPDSGTSSNSSSGTSSPTTTPFTTPNTENCPNRTTPPAPIDESEVPAPGETVPPPLPVPAQPVGGEELGKCGAIIPDGAAKLPKEISATGWVLSDLDTGQVLAAKDPHGRYRPASTIKILLSLVALRELDLNKVVTGTQADANVDGTRVGIGPGGKYTNLELMHALLMASGNDAAHAIAAQLGGDAETVSKMNAEAKSLGALDTRAATPSGLDGPGMSSSPYDMSLFFREAMKNPTFADLIHTEQFPFPGSPPNPQIPSDTPHPGFPIANDNHLLFDYNGALGGKTGYTDDARQTFVAGAERNGRRLAIVLMKADVLPIRPPEQGARLLDYGFAMGKDMSVGSLADATAAPTTPIQVAAPPAPPAPSATATPSYDNGAKSDFERDLDKFGVGKAALLAISLIIVAALAWWSRSVSRRRK